jgi:hypothetical protein
MAPEVSQVSFCPYVNPYVKAWDAWYMLGQAYIDMQTHVKPTVLELGYNMSCDIIQSLPQE